MGSKAVLQKSAKIRDKAHNKQRICVCTRTIANEEKEEKHTGQWSSHREHKSSVLRRSHCRCSSRRRYRIIEIVVPAWFATWINQVCRFSPPIIVKSITTKCVVAAHSYCTMCTRAHSICSYIWKWIMVISVSLYAVRRSWTRIYCGTNKQRLVLLRTECIHSSTANA